MSESDSERDLIDQRATAASELLAREASAEDGRGRRGRSGRSGRRASRRVQGRGPAPTIAGRDRRSVGWAAAFAVLGVGAAVLSTGGVVAEDLQGAVAALGGAGVFLSLLTLALTRTDTPYRDAALLDTLAGNYERVVGELGLASVHYYVPTGGEPPVRLFVPQREEDPVPSVDKLTATFVGQREASGLLGLAFDPCGLALLPEVDTDLPDEPNTLVARLCGAVVDRMELAEIAQPNVDVETGQATLAFRGTAYGPIEQFDHPVRSFVGVGLATGLNRPVKTEVIETADGEFRIRYSWRVD